MKLKCIGGPAHNKYEIIQDDCRIGDMVRVREPRKVDLTINIPLPFDPHKMSELTTDIIHLYIYDALHYTNDGYKETIKFLRYKDLSHWEAIKRQFE